MADCCGFRDVGGCWRYRGLAEGAGFEPAIRFPVYTLSRRAPSTTRPPLHAGFFAARRRGTNGVQTRNPAPAVRTICLAQDERDGRGRAGERPMIFARGRRVR